MSKPAFAKRVFFLCLLWLTTFHACFVWADESKATTNQPVVVGLSSPPEGTVYFVCDSTNEEPLYQGLPFSSWLDAKTTLNSNRLSLSKLLSLKQTVKADEWGQVGFEMPISYDALQSNPLMGGELTLGYFNTNGDFIEGCFTDCERATNGNCLVWWDTNYDPWGKHDIRAKLIFQNRLDQITVIGPPLPFYSSNVCRFFEGYSLFVSDNATLLAKLREPIARYRIELTTTNYEHLKSITGSVTNGLINLEWNLKDERDRKFKGDSFYGFFYVTYPDDQRSSNAPAGDRFNKIGSPLPP